MFMMKSRNKGFTKENAECVFDQHGQKYCSLEDMCHLNYWYPGQV